MRITLAPLTQLQRVIVLLIYLPERSGRHLGDCRVTGGGLSGSADGLSLLWKH